MKIQSKIKKLLAGFILLCCINGYAAEYWSLNDIEKFPIQTSFVRNTEIDWINPFEMSSWSFGIVYPRFHRNFFEDLKHFKKRGKKWFSTPRVYNVEYKYEMPFYSKRTSIGLDCILYPELPEEVVNFIEMYRYGTYSLPRLRDSDSLFDTLLAFEFLGTSKLKASIHNVLGHFAGFVALKGGAILIGMAENSKSELWTAQHGTGIKTRPRPHYRKHNPCAGFVIGISVGSDWYFSQWMGCFIEFSAKYNYIPLIMESDLKRQQDVFFNKEKFGYTTTAFTFGLKTTY